MEMMDAIPEEFKSLFPISSVFKPPLLFSNPSLKPILGPLIFNPKPNSAAVIFSSPALLPPPPHLPRLSLPRFLATSAADSALLPSTSSSAAVSIGPINFKDDLISSLRHNRLQFIQCPPINTVVVFFPTGVNSDRVGFLHLVVKAGTFHVKSNFDSGVFCSNWQHRYRISRISVNPVPAFSGFRGKGKLANGSSTVPIGYLLASSMFSVQWFIVKIVNSLPTKKRKKIGDSGSNSDYNVRLVHVASKVFKSCCVVHACWSPHVLEQSAVLLENGTLFLFDLEPHLNTPCSDPDDDFKGKRLKVVWDNVDGSGSSQNYRWLSCEFSWHPKVLIVARSDVVFLVDFGSREDVSLQVSCLMKIEVLRMYASIEKEHFLMLSRTGSDNFHFVLASDTLLLLCDVRRPLMPLLQWSHGLEKPSYLESFKLSELRSRSSNDTSKWATDSGFCIIMGSFWNCEFSIFCYGPSLPAPIGSIASKIAECQKPIYAWELPSDLLLSGRECRCGNCLVREEFLKDALPEWMDWQQKKEIALGFGIVNKDLSALLSEPDDFGGFTMIRLMSSGTFELQRYFASENYVKNVEDSHRELLHLKDYLLCPPGDKEYKFPRRFKYITLKYLSSYLDGKLVLDATRKIPPKVEGKELFSPENHEIVCKKLLDCGFGHFRASPAITSALNDISLPESVHEVVLRRLWSDLPMELLQLAFSNYSECLEVLVNKKKVALEFPAVPDLSQLPPFILRKPSCRSNKWSQKVQRGDALVGPVLPLPVLLTLHRCPNSNQQLGGFQVEAEISRSCDEVIQAAGVVSDSKPEIVGDQVTSLANDGEEPWSITQKPKAFLSYQPIAAKGFPVDHTQGKSVYKDKRFDTLISKVSEKKHAPNEDTGKVGLELFDDLCPVKLRFDERAMMVDDLPMMFEGKELAAYSELKGNFLKWQKSFDLYQEFSLG